jgi:hypothetical protein
MKFDIRFFFQTFAKDSIIFIFWQVSGIIFCLNLCAIIIVSLWISFRTKISREIVKNILILFSVTLFRNACCLGDHPHYHHHCHHQTYSPVWALAPQASVTCDLYPGHPPSNFYNPVSMLLPLPSQSILISVGPVLVDLHDLYTMTEHSRCQSLIQSCSVSLSTGLCLLLRVITEVSV